MKFFGEKRGGIILGAYCFLFVAVFFAPYAVFAQTASPLPQTRQELENLIAQRSQELEAINRKLETAQGNLQETKTKGISLQRELAGLQNNINQLDLNIKSDEITNQKLALEINSLQYDIHDIETSIAEKKDAIVHLLRELQKTGEASAMMLMLKNETLAQSFLAAQSLTNVRAQLGADVAGLATFGKELDGKVQDVATHKGQIEIHQKNLASRKAIVQDQREERKVILAQTKNKESAYAQQFEELKNQQNTISDEIAKIEDQLRSSFDASILPMKRPGVFTWPIQSPRITQHFGEVSYLYRGKPHNGTDIAASLGTPILAADDGIVMGVDNNDRSKWNKYQYGKYILIRHNNNLATLYGHLSAQIVQKGEQVKRGQLIGYSGKTGYATGPHLHFGVYWAPSILMKSIPPAAGLVPVGVVINPEDYL